MTGGSGYNDRTIGLRVRKNAKSVTFEGLAYILVKMLAGPLYGVLMSQICYIQQYGKVPHPDAQI